MRIACCHHLPSAAMDDLLVLVLLASLVFGGASIEEVWQGWKEKHLKVYSSADEEGSRLSIWRDNYRKILEHNMANHSFTLGLNEFADMVGPTSVCDIDIIF